MRKNSWQDGVRGTNCPILPGTNWTYRFQIKDQIGSYFYFPTLLFQKAAGGYGSIRVYSPELVPVPFPRPDGEFDILIGDWFYTDYRVNFIFILALNVSEHIQIKHFYWSPTFKKLLCIYVA